jgi:hypothetical protein
MDLKSHKLNLKLGEAESYGPELHTDQNNAASDQGTEADATTGFTSVFLTGTGANVFESQNTVVATGTYALKSDANDTPTNEVRFYKDIGTDWGLTEGDYYKISFRTRHIGTGGNWRIALAVDNVSITNVIRIVLTAHTTYALYEYYFKYDANHRYFVAREVSTTNDGGIYLDDLSCKKVIL